MKFTLAILLSLFSLIHAAPSEPITAPIQTIGLSVYEKRVIDHEKRALKGRADKEACVKVTLADGTVWDRFCQPAHACMKITKPSEAPVAFEFPASTVCTMFRGGAGNMDTLDAWCHGTPRDFEGSDKDMNPMTKWLTQNSKGWACYDRA